MRIKLFKDALQFLLFSTSRWNLLAAFMHCSTARSRQTAGNFILPATKLSLHAGCVAPPDGAASQHSHASPSYLLLPSPIHHIDHACVKSPSLSISSMRWVLAPPIHYIITGKHTACYLFYHILSLCLNFPLTDAGATNRRVYNV